MYQDNGADIYLDGWIENENHEYEWEIVHNQLMYFVNDGIHSIYADTVDHDEVF